MITVAICDDSKRIRESMRKSLEEYIVEKQEDIRIRVFCNGEELVEQYNEHYDLMFLDIKMPGMNGIETAQRIRMIDKKVKIIFLTSLIEYALEGYSVNATNYILKPMEKKRLFMEMDRCLEEMKEQEEPFLVIHNDKGDYKLLLKEITYMETCNRNILIHTKEKAHICYWKLSEMERRIGKYGFVRNHVSYLVNLCHVEHVEKLEIKVTGGNKIPISKGKKKDFMEQLAEYWGNHI